MRFPWERLDIQFLKDIVLTSEKATEYDWIHDVEDDPFMLSSVINEMYIAPDKKFIMNYRTLIEQNLLRYYPDEVRKICNALNVPGSNHNVRQTNLSKKATSSSLMRIFMRYGTLAGKAFR